MFSLSFGIPKMSHNLGLKVLLYVLVFSQTLGNFGSIFRSLGINFYIYDLVSILGLFFLIIFSIKNGWFRVSLPFLIIQSLYGVLVIVSLFSYQNLGFSETIKSLLYLLRFGVYFYLLYFVYLTISSNAVSFDFLKKIFWNNYIFLLFLVLIQWIFLRDLGEYQKYGYDPHFSRVVGPFMDPNFLGFYLVIYLILNARFISSNFILFSSSFLIFLTQSRSALICYFIFMVFWLLYQKNLKYLIVLILMVIGIYGSPIISRIEHSSRANDSVNLRFESYENGLNLIEFSDYLGIGVNNYKIYQRSFSMNFDDTNSSNFNDSSWISIIVLGGVVSALLLFGFLLSLNFSVVGFAILTVTLINTNIINSLFYPPLTFFILMLMFMNYAFEKRQVFVKN